MGARSWSRWAPVVPGRRSIGPWQAARFRPARFRHARFRLSPWQPSRWRPDRWWATRRAPAWWPARSPAPSRQGAPRWPGRAPRPSAAAASGRPRPVRRPDGAGERPGASPGVPRGAPRRPCAPRTPLRWWGSTPRVPSWRLRPSPPGRAVPPLLRARCRSRCGSRLDAWDSLDPTSRPPPCDPVPLNGTQSQRSDNFTPSETRDDTGGNHGRWRQMAWLGAQIPPPGRSARVGT